MNTDSKLIEDLRIFYDSRCIGALSFACPYYAQCCVGSPGFTKAKESYVGPEYEAHTVPRLLFLSLDSGSADPDPQARTMAAIRAKKACGMVTKLRKGLHWYETHALAWRLLQHFRPDITIEDIGPFFAHTNSAKCCQNNPHQRVAADVMFKNCRGYIPDEVRVFAPDILITQGNQARKAITGAFPVEPSHPTTVEGVSYPPVVLRLTEHHRTLWLHTPHPASYGPYRQHETTCWPVFERAVVTFMRERGITTPVTGGNRSSKTKEFFPPNAPPLEPPHVDRVISRVPPLASYSDLDYIPAAFQTVVGKMGRPFGTAHTRRQGVSDDARGVQWNAGVDRELDMVWLGVNLEGMEYDGWPIARFIERELDNPSLVDLCRSIPKSAAITMSWRRDAWQVTARLPILERQIGSTPISLAILTSDTWRAILLEAYQCLNPDKHRSRARQTVTTKTGPFEKWVSPHLHFSYVIWRATPGTVNEAEAAMRPGQEVLQPIHGFTKIRSA